MIKIPAFYLEELAKISDSLSKLDDETEYLGAIRLEVQFNEDPEIPNVGRFVWENDQWYFIPDSFFEG